MGLRWTEDLAVDLAEIDYQHKELFTKLESLLLAMKAGKGKTEISSLMNFLGGYVVKHFTAEERLMRICEYPGLPAHKAQHAAFIRDFSNVKKHLDTAKGNTPDSLLVNRHVGDWLIRHIGVSDKAFGGFLKEQQRRAA